MEDFSHILLFKTDIKSESCKQKLQAILDSHTGIEQWNVALDDQDCVLRIVSHTLKHEQIITLIQSYGHTCTELV